MANGTLKAHTKKHLVIPWQKNRLIPSEGGGTGGRWMI